MKRKITLVLLLITGFLLTTPVSAVIEDDDYEWDDMESKELYKSIVENSKVASTKMLIENAKNLLQRLEQKIHKDLDKRTEILETKRHKRCLLESSKKQMDLLDKFKSISALLERGECGQQAAPAIDAFKKDIQAWSGEMQ